MLCSLTVLLQLFDAALVANSEHAASWHGWGLLEKRQGNFRKARDLWMKVHSHSRHTPKQTMDSLEFQAGCAAFHVLNGV